jgi:hypothetical protein
MNTTEVEHGKTGSIPRGVQSNQRLIPETKWWRQRRLWTVNETPASIRLPLTQRTYQAEPISTGSMHATCAGSHYSTINKMILTGFRSMHTSNESAEYDLIVQQMNPLSARQQSVKPSKLSLGMESFLGIAPM